MNEKDGCPKASPSADQAIDDKHGPVNLEPTQGQEEARESSGYHYDPYDESERQARAIAEWFSIKFQEATLIDVVGIATGIVLVIVGIIAACIYDGQLDEMRHSNQLTQQALANGAQSSLDASNQFQTQLRHFDASLGRTGLLAKHAGEQATQAAKIADIADFTLRQSQRAWVTATDFKVNNSSYNIAGVWTINGTVTLKNTGASVATEALSNFWIIPNGKYLKTGWNLSCGWVDDNLAIIRSTGETQTIGVLIPPNDTRSIRLGGGGMEVSHTVSRRTVEPSEVDHGLYYIIGCTRYVDQLTIIRHTAVHHSQWCFTPKNSPPVNQDGQLILEPCQAFEYAH